VGAVDSGARATQQRAARWQPVDDRAAAAGDTLLLDLTRTRRTSVIEIPWRRTPCEGRDGRQAEALQNVTVELGARTTRRDSTSI
jgi:hypothetical protein